MKPLIGLSVDVREINTRHYHCLDMAYVKAISAAGGIPFLIPPGQIENIPEIVSGLNGVMFIGGDDYDPAYYGQEPSEHTKVGFAERQEFDMALAKYVLHETTLPVLGICAGCQAANIALGGTLYQDVPTTVPDSKVSHGGQDGKFGTHGVSLSSHSKLRQIYNSATISVPTWHHQSIKKPGAGLNIVSWAEDGIVEAIELDGDRFVVGVQWHPEQDLDNHLCLFTAFVESACVQIAKQEERELVVAG